MIRTRKAPARFLSALLCLVMMLTLLPTAALAADIGLVSGHPTITPNIGIDKGTVVGFAGQEWWVIGDDASGVNPESGHITLLLKSTGNPYGDTMFRTGQAVDPGNGSMTQYSGYWYANNPGGNPSWLEPSEYNGSTLHQKMESIASGFPSAERALIQKRATLDAIKGSSPSDQLLWPLSYTEWKAIGNNKVRGFGNYFWLRTPRTEGLANVGTAGGGSVGFDHVGIANYAARPAFNLNLSSVLFTSAATAGSGKFKPATVGSGLSSAEPTTGAIKFTFLDTSMALDVTATTSQLAQSGGTLTLGYRGATTGQEQWVSCVLKDGNDVEYYGKLADASSVNNGTLSIPFTGVPNGTYTLEIFSEQDNGDNSSDFAGNPVTLTVTVSSGNATITNPGTLTQLSNDEGLSNDAGLASVAKQAITAGSETGTSGAPKTASVNVANSVSSVALADFVTSEPNATATLYSDAFTTVASSVSLNVGANDVYIKVTAEDGTELFYKVNVTRAAPPPATYTLIVDNGTGGGSYTAGAQVNITANAAPQGQVFDKWTSSGGGSFLDANSASTTFTMPDKDVTVTATYKDAPVTTYAVTVNSGTGGGDFAEGATVSITANAAETGKVFDKWTTTDGVTFGDANSANTTFVMPANDVTVTATYKDAPVTTYAVTVNSGTGSGNFAEGATVSITANAPETGKVFDKWTTTDGVTFANANSATTTFVMPANDVAVTATYKDAPVTTYAVTVNSGTGSGNFAAGATVTITANEPETGKVFDKWTTTDGVEFENVNNTTTTFVMPANDVAVTATYKDAPVTTYAVTVNSGTGSGNFAAGATVTITANEPETGKVFDKWTTTDGVEFENVNNTTTTFVMPANDVAVTATYKDAPVTTYAVTVNSGTGSGNFAAGATVSITANAPATGKVFDKWTTTDGVAFANANSATTTFVMPAKAVTVTATYKDAPVTTYAVTVNSGTGGGDFAEGATVSITANAPATGKVFDKWTTTDGVTFGDANSANTTFVMPAKAVTVTATYKDAPVTTYAVTVNSGTGGGNFAAGATVSITANAPATGKVFDKWTTSDGVTFGDANSATTTFVMPAKAVTVTATYKDAPVTTYAVTVNSGTGGGDFAEGATVSITANAPATGKVFDKWTTTDGVTFGDANSATTTFVMPAKAVTVTATYKDISSETPDYKIIAGENGIWKKGNTKGIVIISNGDYGDFTGVNVDGIFIDSSNYTSAAGSTVVTLKPAYLETLALGTHIVTLQFGNYSVQTNLTILAADERPDESKPDESKPDESKPDESKPNEEIPKTGESNHTLPLIGLLLLSGSALIGVTRNKKKKKSYNK